MHFKVWALLHGLDATSVTFGVLGNKTYTLAHGADYGVTKYDVSLGDIISGYEVQKSF